MAGIVDGSSRNIRDNEILTPSPKGQDSCLWKPIAHLWKLIRKVCSAVASFCASLFHRETPIQRNCGSSVKPSRFSSSQQFSGTPSPTNSVGSGTPGSSSGQFFHPFPVEGGRVASPSHLEGIAKDVSRATMTGDPIGKVIQNTVRFNDYKLTLGETGRKRPLTAFYKRPANLLFDAICENGGWKFWTTQPSDRLFAWEARSECSQRPPDFRQGNWVSQQTADTIRSHIEQQAVQGKILSVQMNRENARRWIQKFWSEFTPDSVKHEIDVMELAYGDKAFQISYQEILDILDSQKVSVSEKMPIEFYLAFQKALQKDKRVILPAVRPALNKEAIPDVLGKMKSLNCKELVKDMKQFPEKYGFNRDTVKEFLKLNLYELGAMVVKWEDYHLFMNAEGRIFSREVGGTPPFRLISLCGIRGIAGLLFTQGEAVVKPRAKEIMKETFKVSMQVAETGILLVPAVGMGVWEGPPDVYWPALFDAVVEAGSEVESILVHPMKHAETFVQYLEEAQLRHQDHPNRANLDKIRNLGPSGTDLLQLARNLKETFPDKIVALINASDPDVTLGWHIGEYTNNRPHGSPTTEEHYCAAGTSGLGFPWLTKLLDDPNRVLSFSQLCESTRAVAQRFSAQKRAESAPEKSTTIKSE